MENKMPRLLRQAGTGRIYVATKAQSIRADMVLLDPSEVQLGPGGYEYIGSGRTGLELPKPVVVEPEKPVVVEPEKPVVVEPDPLSAEPEPFIVNKQPFQMKVVELKELAENINQRFPELAIDMELDRSPMIKACNETLKKITALAEQE